MARKSLPDFTSYLDLGFEPAAHHRLLLQKLEAVERGEIKRLLVNMPPGSAKSTYGSIIFPSWFLGRNPRKSVIAASHTSELAERFGRRVRNTLMAPEYRSLFPDAGLSTDSQAAGRWGTEAGGEYLAAGVGGAIVGFRADLAILDDPVAGREEADSEREREKLWEWYKADLWTRLKPGGAIVCIMQRWREDDLAGRLLDEAAAGGEQWEVVKLRMEATEDDPLGRQPGEPLWPEWFTSEQREQARRDPRAWFALYQQEPRPESGGEFKKEWLQHYRQKPERGLNTYILVDPASEKRESNDYTAIFVVGASADQNYYVLDIVRDRMNLTERGDAIFRLHREYQPLAVGYERYGMASDLDYLRDRQEREQYRFPVHELGGILKKEDRIRKLIPLFERRRVWLPERLSYTQHDGQLRDLVRDFIEEEYAAFPVGRHDDMIDCLSRICDDKLNVAFPNAKPILPVGGSDGGSWMG